MMGLQISKKQFDFIPISLFIFFVVFIPPLFAGATMIVLLMMLMLVYNGQHLLLNRNRCSMKEDTLKLFYGFVPFFIYLFTSTLFRIAISTSSVEITAYIVNIRKSMLTVVYLFLVYSSIQNYLKSKKIIVRIDFIRVFVTVGLMQAMLIFLSYFSDGIQAVFADFIMKHSNLSVMQAIFAKHFTRLVGFSLQFFDALGYVMSGLAIIAWNAGVHYSKKTFCFCAIFIVVASALAARTGILLTFIGICTTSIFYAKMRQNLNLKWVIKCFFVFFGILCLCYLFYNNMSDDRRKAFELGFYYLHALLAEQKIEGTFREILLADLVFPENMLFGIGAIPETMGYFDSFGNYIDSGYIQVIWRFGFVGLLLLTYGHVYFFHKIYVQCGDLYVKSLLLSIGVTMLLYYVKQYPLNAHGTNVVSFVFPLILYNYTKYQLHSKTHISS